MKDDEERKARESASYIEVTKRRRSQRLDHYNGYIFILIKRYLLVNNNYNGQIFDYYY